MTDAEIAALVAVGVGGACHAATGFGLALVAAPLVVAALPPEEAISTLLVLGILTSVLTLATESRRPEPLWREAGEILVWGAAGALGGAFLLAELNRTALQLIVSASVIAALATRRAQTLPKGSDPFVRVGAGLSAGALTTTTSTNGPPLLLYLLSRRLPAARMRDTLSALFVGFGTIGVIAITARLGEFPLSPVLAAFAAAAGVGHLAGRPIFDRLAEGHYEAVVAGLLLMSVVSGAALAVF